MFDQIPRVEQVWISIQCYVYTYEQKTMTQMTNCCFNAVSTLGKHIIFIGWKSKQTDYS